MKTYCLLLSLLFSLSGIYAQEFGLASYYADTYQGKNTAYGEKYDKSKLTAAHKRHPLGTMLRVTRMDDQRSVVVRVNDRGPFLAGRIVELSRAAAEKIGMIKDGITQVKVEVVKEQKTAPASQPTAQATASPAEAAPGVPTPASPAESTASRTPNQEERVNVRPVNRVTAQDVTPYGLYKVSIHPEATTGFGVQVASMNDYPNVLRTVAALEANHFDNVLVSVERGETGAVYKVILGPFDTMAQAKAYAASLKERYDRNGFPVDFSQIDY